MKLNLPALLCIAQMVLILSCEKNDDGNDIPPANRPPGSFILLTVSNKAVEVDLKPTLAWSKASDPDGDPVTYDLVLDDDPNPGTVIESDLSETEITLGSRLEFAETFYWKVVARDNKGNSTESEVFSFTTKDLFSQATANAGFNGRLAHRSVSFKDRIWVIGGIDENSRSKNDVWNSSDGIHWTQVTGNAAFSTRSSFSVLAFNDKLWVIGGYSGGNKNDIWSSSDGVTWTEETSSAQFSPRYAHTTVVFNDKMWLIGGEVGALDVLNDVWNSSDGRNWTKISTINTPEKGRHTAVVFDNKIWLISGLGQDGTKSDVWSSSDGMTWTEVTSNAPFIKRYYHTTVVSENKLWVIGGIGDNYKMFNDVWSSNDGSNWTEVTSDAPFSGRYLHASVMHDEKIWVIGGNDADARKNDVWSMN